MPSTFDPLLRLELQATGENATTWGTKTNNNLDLLAEAISGAVNLNVAGSGDFTLTTANAAEDQARYATLVLTGTLTGNRNVIIPSSPKNYTILNQTSGAFTITVKQAAGTGFALPATGPSIAVATSTTCIDAVGATLYTKTLLAATSVDAALGVLGNPAPTGVITEYGGSSAPTGWLLCDGAAVSRTTYANLFAVIGTTYGIGDNSTTFNVPDRRGRFGIGANVTFPRGSVGGTLTTDGTALTVGQLPAHTHTGTTSTNGNHTHGFTYQFGGASAGNNLVNSAGTGGPQSLGGGGVQAAGDHNHTFTTDATGSGQVHTHTYTPPYIASNYIIKI
jgi:microcystin-dependent protein